MRRRPGMHFRWVKSYFSLLYLSDTFRKRGWNARKSCNTSSCGRRGIAINMLRFENRLSYCFLHNVSTPLKTAKSYKRSTKCVSNVTPEGEREQELKSRNESTVVRKPVSWGKTLWCCPQIVLCFNSCSIELVIFKSLIFCATHIDLCNIFPLFCSYWVCPIMWNIRLWHYSYLKL